MALFDRNNDRNYGRGNMGRGGFMGRAQNMVRRGWDQVEDRFQGGGMDDHLRRNYENRSTMDTGTGYGGGMNRGWNAGSGYNRPMDREGGLHQRNSWSDGAWTADAAERTDREWNHENRGVHDRDGGLDNGSDTTPFQAGWRAGGMSGGMGMNRGEHGWNLGGGDRDWGHTGNMSGRGYDNGYRAGGMGGGGGFMDRMRRGWNQLEDRFDRDDDDRMHMGGGSMRGGTSWAGNYDRDWHQPSDVRGYRDDHGHYGVTHAGGMMGGNAGMSGGMNRYGGDYDRGMGMNRGMQGGNMGRMNRSRYDRDWF